MKITVEKLKKLGACDSGIEYFQSKHSDGVELTDLIREDIKTNDWTILEYADWLIAHCMTYKQCVNYALYAAELVFPEYQEKYPNDPRAYNCIQAIKDFRDGKITRKQLLDAVADAHAAVHAAYATDAAYAAAYAAAHAAAHAAYAAVDAAYAAHDADAAAHDAAHTAADKNAMMIKILQSGITLLEVGNE